MSRSPRLAILAPTVTAAMIAAMVSVVALVSPAQAAETVKVEIRGIPGDMIAGRGAARFQAIFTNEAEARSGVRAVVAVQLPGAPADAIRVARQGVGDLPAEAQGDGTVVFTDPDPFDLQRDGSRTSRSYRLSFRDGAPPGEASITVAAYLNGELLGSAHDSTRVNAGNPGDTPSTAPNTDPGFVPTFDAGPSYSLAPLPVAAARADRDASVPKTLYVLGSLLVAMGVASLFLIFRAPRRVSARVGARIRTTSGASWHPRDGSEGPPQGWPAVGGSGPATRPIRDPGPGTTRPIRDPGPGEALPPWLRP
jgi:hypothetical protein